MCPLLVTKKAEPDDPFEVLVLVFVFGLLAILLLFLPLDCLGFKTIAVAYCLVVGS